MASADGKAALITGAACGMGRAIALALARAGYSLCLAAHNFEELLETRRLSGLPPRRCLLVLIDLADLETPAHLCRTALDHFGALQVVITAGVAPSRARLLDLTQAIDAVLALNLRTPIALTRLAAQHMAERGGGAIINVAALARDALVDQSVHAAARAGLVSFTYACAEELRDRQVRVAAVIPGLAATQLLQPRAGAVICAAEEVAAAVMAILAAPVGAEPVEFTIQPARPDERSNH